MKTWTMQQWLARATLGAAYLAVGVGIGEWRERGHVGQAAAAKEGKEAVSGGRDSYQFFDTLVDLRSQIIHNYVEPVDDQKLLAGAINGMMAELDPYSNYFAKDDLARFDRAVHGQFSGIGAEISQDANTGNFIVISPLEESPALKAGMYAGDRILRIDGEATEGMPLKDLFLKLSGAPGSQVKLLVLHAGEKQPVELSITRSVIQTKSVRGVDHVNGGDWNFLIDPTHRVAYVRISNFMENTADEMDKALLPLINDTANGGLHGIIIDLRFNPGGLLQAGIDVSDRFLDSGVIVTTGRPDSVKRDFVAEATGQHTYPHVPLVILVNKHSASAAEIVAGALQDHRRAILIGERSFGKGSVQTLLTMDNGNAAMKLTTAYYYLPSGRNIMRKKDSATWGVQPDEAFNIPLTDEENRQILEDRANSELIKRVSTTVPVAGAKTETAESPTPSQSVSPSLQSDDRQLQRAVEILIAYEAFGGSGGSKEFAADVTTTRPSASISIPAPASAPATSPLPPAAPAATAPETQP